MEYPRYSKEWWREYRVKNGDKLRAYKREYDRQLYQKYSVRENDRRKKWALNNPIKALAQRTTNAAIQNGKLERKPCEVCGATRVNAHHDDYSKPLVVRWLCPIHHSAVHRM